MTDYDEILANAIAELTELAHSELTEMDEEYAKKQHELSRQSEILNTVEEKLSSNEYKLFKEFRELESELVSRYIQASYIRGAKDCVVLLKKLGVI